jgi:ribosomal protein S18 acetylase RimI-like enzyme
LGGEEATGLSEWRQINWYEHLRTIGVDMGVRVVGNKEYSIGEVYTAISRLYRDHPFPPHFYLIYDLLYEPENSEVIVKLKQGPLLESYVLIWRYGRGASIHIWGDSSLELLQDTWLDANMPHILELYTDESEVIRRASSILYSKGFRNVEVRRFHDMVCDEESFKPRGNERLAVRLSPGQADVFVDYVKRRGDDITVEEARVRLSKRTYYGVFADGKLVSAGAICARLPELALICDVYTVEEYRRRGYATAVTSAATRRIVSSGSTAFLCVEEGNEDAIRIYRKLGYKHLRTRPWLVAKP